MLLHPVLLFRSTSNLKTYEFWDTLTKLSVPISNCVFTLVSVSKIVGLQIWSRSKEKDRSEEASKKKAVKKLHGSHFNALYFYHVGFLNALLDILITYLLASVFTVVFILQNDLYFKNAIFVFNDWVWVIFQHKNKNDMVVMVVQVNRLIVGP